MQNIMENLACFMTQDFQKVISQRKSSFFKINCSFIKTRKEQLIFLLSYAEDKIFPNLFRIRNAIYICLKQLINQSIALKRQTKARNMTSKQTLPKYK